MQKLLISSTEECGNGRQQAEEGCHGEGQTSVSAHPYAHPSTAARLGTLTVNPDSIPLNHAVVCCQLSFKKVLHGLDHLISNYSCCNQQAWQ